MISPRPLLIVEDNPDDADLTLLALRRGKLANEILHARDGVEALDYLLGAGRHADRAADDLPQLMILDLKLPKLDGLEVLRRVRSEPSLRDLPVIVLTSSHRDRDVIESYNLGANAYMAKPVDFAQFMEAVKQLGLFCFISRENPAAYAARTV